MRGRRNTALIIILLAAVALISAGCLEKSKKLGCCEKANASAGGCMLFNISNDEFVDLISDTAWCNTTSGYCNVSVGDEYSLIPICTDDELFKCIEPDCSVMVCGDFTYSPRIAPGVASEEDFEEMAPPEQDEEEITQQFYNAQCRFLPMDSKLKIIMKNSNAVLNRFRIGVGESFDEYDLYKNYFPISDSLCSVNPQGQVDRYMNYLDSDNNKYDPISGLSQECINDSDIEGPFTFGNDEYPTSILPEKSSYKFAESYKYSINQSGTFSFDKTFTLDEYKKLDRKFYRKTLTAIYADIIFQEDVTRAPFECDARKMDCFSGVCRTDFYSRGVSLVYDEDGQEKEVPTDCHAIRGPSGVTEVVCFPTVSVVPKTGGQAPTVTYARVTLRPYVMGALHDNYDSQDIAEKSETCEGMGSDHRCELLDEWGRMFYYKNWYYIEEGYGSYITELGPQVASIFQPGNYTTVRRIPAYWSLKQEEFKWVQTIGPQAEYPPASQIWFFPRDDIRWNGEVIVGLAVIDRDDFKDTNFAEYCGMFEGGEVEYSFSPPEFLSPGETLLQNCINDCTDAGKCGSGKSAECTAYCGYEACDESCGSETVPPECSSYCLSKQSITLIIPEEPSMIPLDGEGPAATATVSEDTALPPIPCNYTEAFDFHNNPNFIELELEDEEVWQDLMDSFEPYFDDRMAMYGGDWENDGCGEVADDFELVLSSVPWIPAYQRFDGNGALYGDSYLVKGSGAPGVYGYLKRNFLDLDVSNLTAMDSCSTRANTDKHGDNKFYTYNFLWPKTVFLLKSKSLGNDRFIGKCKYSEGDKLPEIKSYGWCEPCTLSTLAYQKITLKDNPYLPYGECSTETGECTNLCTFKEEDEGSQWVGLGNYISRIGYYSSCYAPHISDIGDYSGIGVSTVTQNYYSSLEPVGTLPRTEPEATLVKERLEQYMKSGIMPVLDLTDESNWNLTSPYPTGYTTTISFFSSDTETSNQFSEYDFKRLLGNNGASLVIVDKVGNSVSSAERQRILERTNLVRSHCWRCLTAVHVAPTIQGTSTFNDSLSDLFSSDPRIVRNVDVVTTEFTVAKKYNTDDPYNRSEAVVDEISTYGNLTLQYGVPSMITEFWVAENSNWGDDNYEILFSTIIEQEDELVKNGVIGIIYRPVRSKYGAGLVLESVSGVGEKKTKFCAFERSISLLGSTREYAQFSKSITMDTINCTKCTTLEKSTGSCSMNCSNGVACTLPSEGADPGQYKCPENTALEPCTLCNQSSGIFFCNKTYVNGIIDAFNISSRHIDSDLYGDIIGGLETDKCCLQDSTGINYTYIKKTLANVVNVPIGFPTNPAAGSDCGLSSSGALEASTEFCGAKLPVQDYDMECAFQYVPPNDLQIAESMFNTISPEELMAPMMPFSQ